MGGQIWFDLIPFPLRASPKGKEGRKEEERQRWSKYDDCHLGLIEKTCTISYFHELFIRPEHKQYGSSRKESG